MLEVNCGHDQMKKASYETILMEQLKLLNARSQAVEEVIQLLK